MHTERMKLERPQGETKTRGKEDLQKLVKDN